MISISIMLIQMICYGSFCNKTAVTVLRTERLMTSYKLKGVGVEKYEMKSLY
jgi:hypothetical protein